MAGLDSYVKLYSNFNSAIQDDYGGKSLTGNGSASISTGVKKFGAGSLLLASATSDFVSITDDADFNIGSTDWTFDLQVRFVSLPSSGNGMCLFSSWNDSTDEGYRVYVYNNSGTYELRFEYTTDGSTSNLFSTEYSFVIDTWYHAAIERISDKIIKFIDASLISINYIDTDTIYNSSEDFKIGAYNTTETAFLNAYVDEFRFSAGIGRYSLDAYTVPTSNLISDSYDEFLLHLDGADQSTTIVDSVGAKSFTCNNNAELDTAIYELGTASLKLDGVADSISATDDADFDLSNVSFSIEKFTRFNSLPNNTFPSAYTGYPGTYFTGDVLDNDHEAWLFRDYSNSGTLTLAIAPDANGHKAYYSSDQIRTDLGAKRIIYTWSGSAWSYNSGLSNTATNTTYRGIDREDILLDGTIDVYDDSTISTVAFQQKLNKQTLLSSWGNADPNVFPVTYETYPERYFDGRSLNVEHEAWIFQDSSNSNTVTLSIAPLSEGFNVYYDGSNLVRTSAGSPRIIYTWNGSAWSYNSGLSNTATNTTYRGIDSSDTILGGSSDIYTDNTYTTVSFTANYVQNLDLGYELSISRGTNYYNLEFNYTTDGKTVKKASSENKFSIDTFYHFAVGRDSNNLGLFVDGDLFEDFPISTDTIYNASNDLQIGVKGYDDECPVDGYIDEVRFSTAIFRYTLSLFTAPVTEYTTADVTPPSVSNLSPTNLSSSIAVDSNFVVTFDENVTAITGNDIIIKRYSDDVVMETIDAADAKITVSGAQVTINPSITLAYKTKYYIEIEDGAFEDAASNATSGLTGKSFWSFTTIALNTTSIFEVLEFSSTETAEAGTTTTNVTVTAHDMSAEDMIVNTTRRGTGAERGSSRITAIVDADNFTVSTVAGQTTGDSIRFYKYVDRTDKVKIKTLKCSLSTQGTRILGLVLVTDSSWIPQIGQYCRFGLEQNSAYTRYFLGKIQSVDTTMATGNFNVGSGKLFITITAANLTTVAQHRTIEIDYDSGDTFQDIVKDMVDDYLIKDGITQGYIASGESLDTDWNNDIISISDVLDRACKESTFQWFVNEYGSLQFFNEEISISDCPYEIDEEETDPNAFYDYFGITISSNLDEYLNKYFIMGGYDERGNPVAIGSEDFDESTAMQNVCAGTGVYANVMRDSGISGTEYVSAAAGTTTTNITYTNHDQVVGNMIWNLTRNEYRIVTAVVDANNFTVDSVTSQTTADIIVFFDKANAIIQNVFKSSGRINYKLTFLTRTLGFLPGQKIQINLPSFGIDDEYFAITNVEISDFAGIQQKDYNGWILKVDCVIRDNSNFSTQRLKNYEDFWSNF